MSDISWDALVRRNDSDMEEAQYVYEFGDRRFYDSGPQSGVYTKHEGYLVDADGNYIVDANGNKIKVKL